MSALQNYAKFESRVAEWAMNNGNVDIAQSSISPTSFSDWYTSSSSLARVAENIIDNVFYVVFLLIVVFWLFYTLYIFINLFKKWPLETIEEIRKTGTSFIKSIGSLLHFITWVIKTGVSLLVRNKNKSILVLITLGLLSFANSILDNQSRWVKIEKIPDGHVGIDLKNDRVLRSGYHLYSPLTSSFFLSPTNTFDFEIAEVTSNTKEEIGVVLDYRVWFRLKEDNLLPFYKKYGEKNIRSISSDVVMPKLLENIKGIIRNYSFKDISSKHNEIKEITIKEANAGLLSLGIELQDINILDIRLPETYIKSKEDLLNAENELKLAEATLERQKKESERLLLEANASKDIQIIQAQGLAKYNEIVNSQAISNQTLELKRIENEAQKISKWDGRLPNSPSGVNFLENDSMVKKSQ